MEQNFCRITRTTSIPISELRFSFSRSSGAGGQHVNKVNTKVTVRFDIDASATLSDRQKTLIKKRLSARINNRGELRIDGERYRSQAANREDVIRRLAALLSRALYIEKPRKPTRPGAAAREKRLQAKKRRGRIKQLRRAGNFND